MSAGAGDTEIVRTLLSTAGAQSLINYQNANVKRSFVLKGHSTVSEQLIEARCHLDLEDQNGYKPLHIAAENGNASVTKQLIAAQSDVDLQAKDGATPNDFPVDTIRTQSTPQATKRITKDPLVWREHEPINGVTTPKSINSTPKSLSGRGIQAPMESAANVMRQKMLEDLRSSNSASPHPWINSKNSKSTRHVVDRVVSQFSHFRQAPRRHFEAASLPLRMALDALPSMVERNRGFDSM